MFRGSSGDRVSVDRLMVCYSRRLCYMPTTREDAMIFAYRSLRRPPKYARTAIIPALPYEIIAYFRSPDEWAFVHSLTGE